MIDEVSQSFFSENISPHEMELPCALFPRHRARSPIPTERESERERERDGGRERGREVEVALYCTSAKGSFSPTTIESTIEHGKRTVVT